MRAIQGFLSASKEWKPRSTGLSFERLDSAEVSLLERPFTKEETFLALEEFSGDKTPSPHGFSMAFWQSAWDIIELEIMGFSGNFFKQSKFVKSINATFIVLISKKWVLKI